MSEQIISGWLPGTVHIFRDDAGFFLKKTGRKYQLGHDKQWKDIRFWKSRNVQITDNKIYHCYLTA